MTRPSLARHPLIGRPRPDPAAVQWSPADLARRRALLVARQELEAAEARGDPPGIVRRWRDLVGELARAELAARSRT